ADVQWDSFYNYSASKWEKFQRLHKKSDFEDLLASSGSYFGRRSIDDDPIHGSFRDYFWAISR
ncbi:MAG: hypothetical protein ACUVTG_09720, partial [Candidatus Oleimicrobiaceae bacterium]